MSELKRWSDSPPSGEPLEQRAIELLRATSALERWDDLAHARLRREVAARLEQKPNTSLRARAPLLGAVAVCGLLLAAIAVHHARSESLSSHVTIAAGTQVHVLPAAGPGDDDHLSVMQGLVSVSGADSKRGLQLQTPHLSAAVRAVSFFVEVAGERTTLFVTQGEAWVGKVRLHLLGGQSIRSDDPRLVPAPPTPSPGAPSPRASPGATRPDLPDRCSRFPTSEARFDCYLEVSMGSDQMAQNALFELGVIESEERHDGPSAIVTWGAYLKRFPRGALAPEASFSILSEYLAERRAPEALNEAALFVARFPTDSRGDEVRLAAAALACGARSQAPRALALLEPVLRNGAGSTRTEALSIEAACRESLRMEPNP